MVQAFSTVNIFEQKSLATGWVTSSALVVIGEMPGARDIHMFETLDSKYAFQTFVSLYALGHCCLDSQNQHEHLGPTLENHCT